MTQQVTADERVAATDESVAKRTTSIYLPVPMLNELDEVAAGLDRPRTWVIQRAVEEWLDRQRPQTEHERR